jgi:hypothetical protein
VVPIQSVKDKLQLFMQYFSFCDTFNKQGGKMDKYQREQLLIEIDMLEKECIDNMPTLHKVINNLK